MRKVKDLPHIGRQSRIQKRKRWCRQDARAPGNLDAARAFSAL